MPQIEFVCETQELISILESEFCTQPFSWVGVAHIQWRRDVHFQESFSHHEFPGPYRDMLQEALNVNIGPFAVVDRTAASKHPLQNGLIYGLLPWPGNEYLPGGFYLDKARYVGEYDVALKLFNRIKRSIARELVRTPFAPNPSRPEYVRKDIYFSAYGLDLIERGQRFNA